MDLVSEQQGYAEWESARKYPKMQIRTVKDLLENPKNPFEIPGFRPTPPHPRNRRAPAGAGRGRAVMTCKIYRSDKYLLIR